MLKPSLIKTKRITFLVLAFFRHTPSTLRHGYHLGLAEIVQSVTIYDIAGTPVRSISVGYLQAGSYVSQSSVYWDGKADTGERVASGTYFYTLKTEGYTSMQKMIILK